jgi:hypothetical protein
MTEDNNTTTEGDHMDNPITALEELVTTNEDDRLGMIISGSLELLTMNALDKGSFYLESDDGTAVTVIAVNEDATALKDALPEAIVSWETFVADFETNSDPGDEQVEPTTEQE